MYKKSYFNPGENIRIEKSWFKKARPVYSAVRVTAPARLHFSVFDFLAMNPPLSGGGGIGISTSTFQTVVKVESKNSNNQTQTPAAFLHLKKLFCKLVNYDEEKLSINIIKTIAHKHSGFGSNVTGNTALYCALNKLFGDPYAPIEIFKILTNNYVEHKENKKIYFGFDSGLGEAAVLFDGFVLVDTKCNYISNIKSPNIWAVTAVADKNTFTLKREFQNKKRKTEETETLETAPEKISDFQMRNNRRLYKLQKNLVTYFNNQDTDSFYKNIWDINRLGIFEYMRSKYDAEILDEFVKISKECGAFYAGISSVGPSMFALTKDKNTAKNIKLNLENNLSDFFSNFKVGKAGEKIKYEVAN